MSELIASKIKENRKTKNVNLMARELEILVNSMDSGVISTDENGMILRYNLIAGEMFNINQETGLVKNVSDIIEGIAIQKIKENKCHISNNEFLYTTKGIKYRGYYNAKPIMVENNVTGFIFTFNKINELIKVVNDIASTNMIITFEDIIGNSNEIDTVKDYSKRIAKGRSTVLIQGESGTGKELFARAIHYESDRRNRPFVAINCTAIPENLIESELFGYEEGAFTGARKGGKIGKFELANKGTIFLDEIGDMPLNLQTKLLRVLQGNVIERVGGNTSIPVDVRIIAASNKLLEEKVREREFREDLFYRLNVIPIHLPPLRTRLQDIEVLSHVFLIKFNQKLDRHIEEIDPSVLELFKNYKWPGTVRELENVIEYGVNMSADRIIKIGDLPRRLKENEAIQETLREETLTPIKELERVEIEKALKLFGDNSEGIERAAEVLGISRATIYRKIKAYE
jgi:transcriptional regulator with PAS, ATPase and Fis domain